MVSTRFSLESHRSSDLMGLITESLVSGLPLVQTKFNIYSFDEVHLKASSSCLCAEPFPFTKTCYSALWLCLPVLYLKNGLSCFLVQVLSLFGTSRFVSPYLLWFECCCLNHAWDQRKTSPVFHAKACRRLFVFFWNSLSFERIHAEDAGVAGIHSCNSASARICCKIFRRNQKLKTVCLFHGQLFATHQKLPIFRYSVSEIAYAAEEWICGNCCANIKYFWTSAGL